MGKSTTMLVLGVILVLGGCGGGGGGGGGAPDVLFFAGNDGAGGASYNHNYEVWSFDGASQAKVAEVNPGVNPSYPLYFTALGDLVLFQARYLTDTDTELFATDGSEAWLVKDINPGTQGSHPKGLKVFKSWVYMMASPGGAQQLWRTNGTAAGTTVVVGAAQGIVDVMDFAVVPDDKIYFIGRSAAAGTGLFYTDGTSAVVESISVGFVRVGYGNAPDDMVVRGTDVFFPADDGAKGMELWMSSGPGTGSTLVADIEPGAGSSYPGTPAVMGSTVVFSASRSDVGRELWSTTGAAGSTTLVADLNTGGNSSPWSLYVHGGLLYFTADDGASGWEPYVADLLAAPSRLADINSAEETGSVPWNYTAYKGKVYFYADDGVHAWELWVTDGTGPGTEMVFDLNPNGNGVFPD